MRKFLKAALQILFNLLTIRVIEIYLHKLAGWLKQRRG